MNLERNLVCTGIDDNYLWPWMVSIYSAKVNATNDFHVLLGFIRGTLSEKNIKLIEDFCATFEIKLELQEFEFNYEVKTSNLPIQAYIRLLWFDILEEDFLWLDSDTLLLANWQSIFSLSNPNQNKIAIRAVVDESVVKYNLSRYPKNLAYQRGGSSYFNSGIFIGNPRVWKSEGFHISWPKVAANHKELGFVHHDQDVLNFLTHDSKEIISPSFNSIVMQGSHIDQKILHFTGRPKPWNFDSESKIYFSSLEILKNAGGSGAFGGLNWLWEYQNYWRYEADLFDNIKQRLTLFNEVQKIRFGGDFTLMGSRDKIKLIILRLCGRKWL
jgi:lipopolysaccharide biosynthesis glycosyltransferase